MVWCQPMGPLCLWQCFIKYFDKANLNTVAHAFLIFISIFIMNDDIVCLAKKLLEKLKAYT